MRFFIGLFALILLGSCASMGKGVFIKRKYNKGYHIDLANKKSIPAKEIQVNTKAQSIKTHEVIVIKPEIKGNENVEQSERVVESFGSSQPGPKRSIETKTPQQSSAVFTVKDKVVRNVLKVNARRNSYAEFKFGLLLILFVLLTILYTAAILSNYPGFPFYFALVIAVLGACLTLLTGQVFL